MAGRNPGPKRETSWASRNRSRNSPSGHRGDLSRKTVCWSRVWPSFARLLGLVDDQLNTPDLLGRPATESAASTVPQAVALSRRKEAVCGMATCTMRWSFVHVAPENKEEDKVKKNQKARLGHALLWRRLSGGLF